MKKIIKKFTTLLFPSKCKVIIMGNSFVSDDSEIGEHTYIGYNCFVTKATIGRYCSIANNVSIGLGEHDITEISTSSYFYNDSYQKLTEKDCIIGNDVWIGVDSIIRRGVRIGTGAVIGANSFVNTDVPDYAIFAGSPAKLIKFRFEPKKVEILLSSKWWELSLENAREKIKALSSIS